MIPALNDSTIGAGLLFNTVTQTDDLQHRPKWTLIVSLKRCSWQEDIHHVTKRVVYFCYNGLHQPSICHCLLDKQKTDSWSHLKPTTWNTWVTLPVAMCCLPPSPTVSGQTAMPCTAERSWSEGGSGEDDLPPLISPCPSVWHSSPLAFINTS